MRDREIRLTKEDIQKELDKKCIEDIQKLLETPEGRRFFSWLILISGFNSSGIRGNSQDFYISGRRSVGADVLSACNALGLKGMELRHQAEKEYFKVQMDIEKDLKHNERM